MGLLTIFAMSARAEAQRQRTEAEGLVEFMLTDLRGKLKGVGRLDIMTPVNERALKYYGDQDLRHLPVESLERRARILHAIGEDDETRGDDEGALAEFREANRTTAALLAAAPDDPERIYDQAQSEYWIGTVDYSRERFAAAKPAFQAYERMANRLVVLQPANPRYLREAGYAEGNLCSIALQPPANVAGALKACEAALQRMQAVARRLGESADISDALINRHAWLSDAYVAAGDLVRARSERLEEQRLLDRRVASDPHNIKLTEYRIAFDLAMARIDELGGHVDAARDGLKRALRMQDGLITLDSSNRSWFKQEAWIKMRIFQVESKLRGDRNGN